MTEQEQRLLDDIVETVGLCSGKNIMVTLTALDTDGKSVFTKAKTLFSNKVNGMNGFIALCTSSLQSQIKSLNKSLQITATLGIIKMLAHEHGLEIKTEILFDNEEDANSRSGSANSPTADGE